MGPLDETIADYAGLHLTTGPHLMAYVREEMDRRGVVPAAALDDRQDGEVVRVAGAVIVRQRPGTAKGFVFLTMEDETGTVQAIIRPDLFQEHRPFIVSTPVLLVEGSRPAASKPCKPMLRWRVMTFIDPPTRQTTENEHRVSRIEYPKSGRC